MRTISDRVTAEDRLRLHVHDPDTFEFAYEDAEALVEEIDALRAPPSGEAGEPVAWMTEDGRVASDETKRTAMASVSKEVFCIPLYRALPTIKEPTDGK